MISALLLTLLGPAAIPVEVESMDGRRFSGELVQLDREGIRLQTAGGTEQFSPQQLAQVVPQTESASGTASVPRRTRQLKLLDGSTIYVAEYAVQSRRVSAELPSGIPIRLTTRAVRFVRFKPPDPLLDEQWQAIVAADLAGDVVVIRKTGQGTAAVGRPQRAVLDQVGGILGDVATDKVSFDFEGSEIAVARDKVEGLIYHQARARELPEPIARVTDQSGSTWFVRSLTLEADALQLVTPAGVRCRLPLNQLVGIDYSVGNQIYLDELTAVEVDFRPRFVSPVTPPSVREWFQPRQEADLGLSYDACPRGMTLHSRTQLVYRLRRPYRRFRATVGIDPRFRESGQVRLQISQGEQLLFDQEILGTDEPQELDLPLGPTRRLTILVDFGSDDSDRGDHLSFCNARLVK